ncbi:VOC family protein [Dankookia sp. P2]|uniref:VOC family protein n=1 Tax=Dankookia sp. P2 TaxID=3423955 RepID=UPI003D674EC6
MTWSILGASLVAHDLAASGHFFGTLLGLGTPRQRDARTLGFGPGLRLQRPEPRLSRAAGALFGPAGARHVAIAVEDLPAVAGNLGRAGLPCLAAEPAEFGTDALWTLDPAQNLVAFCERRPGHAAAAWHLHHVNLPAADVREATAFYVEMAGMTEGRWRAPAARGDFSIDPAELAVLTLGTDNSGLHIIRPDPGFALRNGFAHNPSIGGHPAFCVPDAGAVKARLEAAGVTVSDAGVYAMAGMRQIYVLDPAGNMIEVNQRV